MFLLSATSCVVLVKRDNGRHKGWFKHPQNPHNPYNSSNGKHKSNSQK